MDGRLTTALREHFGFPAFRPGQAEAASAALEGRDTLVVMPTGAGKSLCYQLPALVRDDLSIVVSPLVSLMQDQVEALERAAPGRAALINAQQDAGTNRDVLARARGGDVKLLYVAPERFSSPGFLEALREVPVGLFVVDEAHCVSQWGHDFRPDYFRLGDAARWLGARAIVASTATATPQVARDIEARLGLREAVKVTTGFDRPNLSFSVVPCATVADKQQRIAAALADPADRPAIVYAGTRAATEALAGDLSTALGTEVVAYHAGLPRGERAETQRRFMRGDVEVVVATNAFGMGVDKADVRSVLHAVVPPSVEAYYQEAGRAGRDGAPARALLFAVPQDKALHVHFIKQAEVDEAVIDRVTRGLLAGAVSPAPAGDALPGLGAPAPPPRFDVALRELGADEDVVRAVIGHLARAGVVQPAPSPPDRIRGRVVGPWDHAARSVARNSAKDGTEARWRQFRTVWAFVEDTRCRRAAILDHFGDPAAPAPETGCCDVCDPSIVPAAPAGAPRAGRTGGGTTATSPEEVDAAILAVVAGARPSIGRSRVVDVLRGSRAKVVLRNSWDGLPEYGACAHLPTKQLLARVDALLEEGRLLSSSGPYPVLRHGQEQLAA